MKIRVGFVSNSSSSSYVCDICGEASSGYDFGLEDVDMFQCGNHTFCSKHANISIEDLSIDQIRNYCISSAYNKDLKEELKIICEKDIIDRWEQEFRFEMRYHVPEEECPCCQLINPTEYQIKCYLLWLIKKDEKDVISEMKEKFGTTSKMFEVIK